MRMQIAHAFVLTDFRRNGNDVMIVHTLCGIADADVGEVWRA